MLESVRKLRSWIGVCQALGKVHWNSFPIGGKEPWKREHVNGFVAKLARFPLPGNAKCVVDVGANVGSFAASDLSYSPDSLVFAFEHWPRTCAEFTFFISPNPRLIFHQCAVEYQPGAVELR